MDKRDNATEGGMTVTRIRGFDWTYSVDGHEVDLAAYNGNGSCSCDAFTKCALKCLEGGARASDATRCAHILAGWEFVRDNEFERFASLRCGGRRLEVGI